MKKLSIQEMQERIAERFPEEHFEIIQFSGTAQPGKIKCLKCGQTIIINQFGNFLAKNKRFGCKNCHGLWRDREIKIQKIQQKYEILDTFVKNTHTYYHIRCHNCGHERTSTLYNLITHLDCGCSTHVYRKRTGEEFINELNTFHNDTFELVGEYVDQNHKILLRHVACGMIWQVRPSDIIHGRSHCPKCRVKESQGEKCIRLFLEKNCISYIQQYQLTNSKQRFDFFLPELNLAIEYNGAQHYQYIEFFHKTYEGFIQYQQRDLKKKQYCHDHGIQLLIISYKDYKDIEKILHEYISSTTKVRQVPEKATSPIVIGE